SDRARRRLAHGRERLRQQVVERDLLPRDTCLPLGRLRREGRVRQRAILLLERSDLGDQRLHALDRALVRAPEETGEEGGHGKGGIVSAGPAGVKYGPGGRSVGACLERGRPGRWLEVLGGTRPFETPQQGVDGGRAAREEGARGD